MSLAPEAIEEGLRGDSKRREGNREGKGACGCDTQSDQHGCFVSMSMCAYFTWSSSAKDQRCRAENISMTTVIPLVLAQSQPALSLWWHSETFFVSTSEQCFLPWQPHILSTEIKHHFWHVVIEHIYEIQSSISTHSSLCNDQGNWCIYHLGNLSFLCLESFQNPSSSNFKTFN